MADTNKDIEDSPIRGFSIVDSLPFIITSPEREDSNDATEEVSTAETKDGDDDVDVTMQNVEVTNEEDKDDVDTIVLDETDRRDERELNQSTLIITTEDLLDSTAAEFSTTEVSTTEAKEEKRSPVSNLTSEKQKITDKNKARLENQGYFWVSNINRQVKAADLKKFFSQIGRVLTAKILTNGRNYFGYVSMESAEMAAKCIRQLNNTPFDGKKIVVSKDRPDVRNAKPTVVQKAEPKKKKVVKVEPKKEPPADQKVDKVTELKSSTVEIKEKRSTEDSLKYNSVIAELKKKLERSRADAEKYRMKVMEFQRRHDGMRKKCETLERELKDSEYKIREERRKLNRDREQFEKTKKLEQIRFDADRAVVNRELDEVKKLREHLKEKIEEFKAQSKKVAKRRSRSPPVLRGRVRSPPLRTNNSSNAFRLEERKRKRDVSRGRTPPPPPKLGDGIGKKRSEREVAAPSRSYFGDTEKRPPALSQNYEFRHKPGYGVPPDDFRGHWPTTFQKDPRRPGTGPSSSQSYPPEVRFGAYQFGSSSISTPSRSYYPEYGKSYGTY